MEIVNKKIKKILRSAIRKNHRTLMVILGSSGFSCVPSVHQLVKKLNKRDISAIWCSKNEKLTLQFENEDDHDTESLDFKPKSCSYSNLQEIEHEVFDMVVLQDLDASNIIFLNTILPNIKGGGVVILLIPTVNSIEELNSFSLSKDEHSSRFGKRFIQSLGSCSSSIVTDDKLNLLSSTKISDNPDDEMMELPSLSEKIESIKAKCNDDVMKTLLDLCSTGDQTEFLYKCLDTLNKRTFHAIISASSAFGRGKTAALGLAIAGSIAMNYSNIFISSSSFQNVDVLFRFLLKGLDALNYEEDKHYDLIESTNPKFKEALIGINLFRNFRQSVRFIFPEDVENKLQHAELVIIDEAASIPIDKLKKLFGPYIVLMSSSTSGSISTSPYLYQKMIQNIQSSKGLKENAVVSTGSLQTVTLDEPVLYGSDDGVESWCNHIFCMESTQESQFSLGWPEPRLCELYCVSQDVLFSGSPFAENFLKFIVSIFNQSNYVTNVEELLKLADSTEYQLFVLLPPLSRNSNKLSSEVLCAIMVHMEYSPPSYIKKWGCRLKQPLPLCFNEWDVKNDTEKLSGLHIVNLATHPKYKRMGYGLRAVELLKDLYEGKVISLDENIEFHNNKQEIAENVNETSKSDASLLLPLSDLKLDKIDFVCVFYKLTEDIFSFWKKAGFVPLYIATSRGSDAAFCAMFKAVNEESNSYVEKNRLSFVPYLFFLLKFDCKTMPASFALSIIKSCQRVESAVDLSKEEVDIFFKPYHMKALERYCVQMQDLNHVIHIVPNIAKLYFKNMLKEVQLPVAQEAILLAYGFQFKSIDAISKDLKLQNTQVVGLLNRTIKKVTKYLSGIIERSVESSLISADNEMTPLEKDLDEELEEAAAQFQKQQEEKQKLLSMDVSQYAIKGTEDEWQKALFTGRKTLVSIKSLKKVQKENPSNTEVKNKFNKNKKQFKRKKH